MSETGAMDQTGAVSETAFVNWIVEKPQRLGGLFAAILYVIVAFGKNISHLGLPSYHDHQMVYDALPSALQCLVLLPALWQCFRLTPPETVQKNHPIASRACNQFTNCLAAVILVWIAFYFLNFL